LTKTDVKLAELLELMRDLLKLGSPRDDIAVGKGKPSPLVAR